MKDYRQRATALGLLWEDLCARFLPVSGDLPGWRLSREVAPEDPAQGWKIHVAATILSACDVLEKVAPFLTARRVLFKAPVSLTELDKINSGIGRGYTQIGKFITVYPQSSEEAVFLSGKLHRLTIGTSAPEVPFDLQYRAGSCVFYRYGAFVRREAIDTSGKIYSAIYDDAGNPVPDAKNNPQPAWVSDPFPTRKASGKTALTPIENPLATTYKIFQAIRQRGKGGVYRAVDLSAAAPRLCIIKEGRLHGEIDWSGCDGFQRVRGEAGILNALQKVTVNVPRVYDTFELEGNFYLVMEHVEGRSLHDLLKKRRRRFPLKQTLKYAAQTAGILARLHRAGWSWRDCKPSNIIVDAGGALKPIDFESGGLIDRPNVFSWQTTAFSPAADDKYFPFETGETEDLYALGAVVYYLLTGNFYHAGKPAAIGKFRRNIPIEMREMIDKLLSPDPRNRPAASDAIYAFSGDSGF